MATLEDPRGEAGVVAVDGDVEREAAELSYQMDQRN
jgi:hypothetical protein